MNGLSEQIAELRLVDHHCHGLVADDLQRSDLEQLATESDWPARTPTTWFDSPLGVFIRAECAPVLGLPQHCSAEGFMRDLHDGIHADAQWSVGFKSIIAYRFGLDFDPAPPSPADVLTAAGEWLSACETKGSWRLDHPVLLLHCYPFVGEAGILALVFPHVYLNTGLAVTHAGVSAGALVRESLKVAPFGNVMFASDAYGLPGLYLAGSLLWRRALAEVLDAWVARDAMSQADVLRYAAWMAADNARNAYRLEEVR